MSVGWWERSRLLSSCSRLRVGEHPSVVHLAVCVCGSLRFVAYGSFPVALSRISIYTLKLLMLWIALDEMQDLRPCISTRCLRAVRSVARASSKLRYHVTIPRVFGISIRGCKGDMMRGLRREALSGFAASKVPRDCH